MDFQIVSSRLSTESPLDDVSRYLQKYLASAAQYKQRIATQVEQGECRLSQLRASSAQMYQKRDAASHGKYIMEAAMNKVRDNISVMQTQWRRSNAEVEALKQGGRDSVVGLKMAELAKMESIKSQEVADHFNTLSLYEKTFGIAISIVSTDTIIVHVGGINNNCPDDGICLTFAQKPGYPMLTRKTLLLSAKCLSVENADPMFEKFERVRDLLDSREIDLVTCVAIFRKLHKMWS